MTDAPVGAPRAPTAPSTPSEDSSEAATVRPYTVTGGRVRSETSDFPLEALVALQAGLADGVAGAGLPPEKRAILQCTARNYVSIAELSAVLHLPLGVTKVLVADLADDGYVTVHTSTPLNEPTGSGSTSPDRSLSVLESVLNGISTL